MRLPIDTSTIKFATAGPAEPVLDFATKAPKTDENGTPLYSVPVFAAGSGIKDSITIKVSGDVKGLGEFTMVKITNLIAQTWEVGDNHGVSFRADRIEVLKVIPDDYGGGGPNPSGAPSNAFSWSAIFVAVVSAVGQAAVTSGRICTAFPEFCLAVVAA